MRHMFDKEEALRFHDLEIRREESEKGIRAVVEALQAVSQSRETAVRIVAEQFGLQPQAAADKVAQYWA